MGSPDVSCVTPVDLNDFFDGDGKIYGYQGLKVVFFLSFFQFLVSHSCGSVLA